MVILNDKHLLFIEPHNAPTAYAVIDAYTRRVTAAFRDAQANDDTTRGWHNCTGNRCNAKSKNYTYSLDLLPGKLITNSLCIHYLAHHREEVPAEEFLKILMLPDFETEPNTYELTGCTPVRPILR